MAMIATSYFPKKFGGGKPLVLALYMLAYIFILVLYEIYLSRYWDYMGFVSHPNGMKIALAMGIIACFSLATPTSADARSFFLNFALTIHLLPLLAIYAYADKPNEYVLVISFAYAVVYIVSAVDFPRLELFKIGSSLYMWASLILTILFILSIVAYGGLRFFNLDLSLVYEFRRDAADNLPDIFGYISSTMTKVIVPFGIAVALIHKRYAVAILFLILSVVVFGLTGHRSVLFSPFLVVIAYGIVHFYRNYFAILVLFVCGLLAGIVSVYLMTMYDGRSLWSWYNTLIIRRALMLPATIDFNYLDYFFYNQFYYWSSSRISLGLVPSPYDVPPPSLIGELYFGSKETSANTGFIGSGFAQAGVWGVALYAAGVGMFIAIFRTYGAYLGLPFMVAVAIGPVMTMLRATDFLTLFLTHGMLLFLLLLVLVRSPASEGPGRQIRKEGDASASLEGDT